MSIKERIIESTLQLENLEYGVANGVLKVDAQTKEAVRKLAERVKVLCTVCGVIP